MAAERRAVGDLERRSDERGGHDRRGRLGRVRAARRQLGGTVGGGVGRQDEPGGADRGGARILLLDGACARTRQAGNAPERLETSATVTFVPGTGITKSALTVRGTRSGTGRGRVPRGSRGREEELSGLAGARGRPRDHARRRARRSGSSSTATRLGARAEPGADRVRAARRRTSPRGARRRAPARARSGLPRGARSVGISR